jgi:hypothetical protein
LKTSLNECRRRHRPAGGEWYSHPQPRYAFVVLSCTGAGADGTNKDSGGPGTYSQLLIIKEYMIRLASDLSIDEGDVYPAEYFDLMGGVGFGGHVFSRY